MLSTIGKKIEILTTALGNYVGQKICDEYTSKDSKLAKLYKDGEYMKNLDTPEFLGNRNNILMAFLLSIYPAKDPNSFQLAMVVESIYNLRKSTLVLPHCYMTNLVQKSILGSKSVTALNGKLLAGGSDTTYRNWLKFNAVPIEYPAGDSDIFIDNRPVHG